MPKAKQSVGSSQLDGLEILSLPALSCHIIASNGKALFIPSAFVPEKAISYADFVLGTSQYE